MFVAKIGGVPAHPANVHRLLYDEQQLVLVFPEGAKGDVEALQGPLQAAPLRPRRLRRGGDARGRADRADRGRRGGGGDADVRSGRALKRLTGLIYFPITPLFPHLGLLGASYLPAKFKLRFLEPVPTDRMGSEPWQDKGLVQEVADDIRARIQDELVEMVGRRRSVWLG